MKRIPALLAVGALSLVPLVAVPVTAQAAACTASLSTNSWNTGFVTAVTVSSDTAQSSWTVTLNLPSGAAVTSSWNGTFSGSTGAVTVTPSADWNSAVGPGNTKSFGFQASGSSTGLTASCSGPGGGGGGTTTTTTRPSTTTTTRSTSTTTTTRTTTTTSRTTSTTSTTSTTTTTTGGGSTGAAPALHVSGNKLLTAAGQTYRLLGVNRSGGEFSCIQGYDMWNGPMDQASITAMRSWKVRTVRVPLNEECWLGTADVPAGGAKGATYQQNVKDYVNLLISNGITPIVEMHWNYGQYTGPSAGCSDVKATCQKPMPDAQYAGQFWTGVANAFKGNNAVVFDLFNEPYPERATGSATSGWICWRDGGTCSGIGYQVAGFQSLLNAVRATGATNVVMIGGLAYSNDLSQWLQYKPTDPTGNLMAFAHIYNFNSCANTSCWDSQLKPVAQSVPLALTEIGENDCASSFITGLMNWADTNGVGYLGWTWNNWDCSTGPSLISDYNGTPTAFGQGFKNHLATVSN